MSIERSAQNTNRSASPESSPTSATFAWLCDVFVVDAHRNRGLSKWLLECVIAHPDLQGVGRIVLATRDAHELYRNYGDFEALPNPEMWMARKRR